VDIQVASLPARNVRNDNFLQRLFLTWVYAIVGAGRNSALQQEALCMPADQAAEAASEKFLKQWAIEQEVAAAAAADKGSDSGKGGGADGKAPQQPSLARALWRSFGLEFALAGVFKLLWSGFVLLGASYFVNVRIGQGQQEGPTLTWLLAGTTHRMQQASGMHAHMAAATCAPCMSCPCKPPTPTRHAGPDPVRTRRVPRLGRPAAKGHRLGELRAPTPQLQRRPPLILPCSWW
jgi:hypothetical protein